MSVLYFLHEVMRSFLPAPLSLSIYIVQVLDAPPPMLYKNMRRPAVEGLMSVHGESRRKFASEEVSAEVVYLQ